MSHQFGPIMVTAHMIFIWSTPRAQSYENRKRLLIQQSGHWGLKHKTGYSPATERTKAFDPEGLGEVLPQRAQTVIPEVKVLVR